MKHTMDFCAGCLKRKWSKWIEWLENGSIIGGMYCDECASKIDVYGKPKLKRDLK